MISLKDLLTGIALSFLLAFLLGCLLGQHLQIVEDKREIAKHMATLKDSMEMEIWNQCPAYHHLPVWDNAA